MYLSKKEMKLLLRLMRNGTMSTAEIEEEACIENIRSLVEKGLAKRTFKGERYLQHQYAIIGISREWEKCLRELFEKVK